MSDTLLYWEMESPVGSLLMGGRDGLLEFLHFPKSARRRIIGAEWKKDQAAFAPVYNQLLAYFAKELTEFDLSYQLSGTDFQQSVWRQLTAIPYGMVRSYGDIAQALGEKGASRAVGMANNANPLPIIVPCHRVIGANSKLVGFGGGLETKIWLLEHEGIDPRSLNNPDQMTLFD
ncbi:MAG: methylated-DNA--[protein]-cysteine S-methyltransferase [Cohaesibacter sp.]|nr:methylated-DNA--[protein]-cysteine S-methyltransferase [Cohaesibacter sp.]MCV6603177.1 methylated-DNA--[protein]-cysteine S-methyltransferase [Cohaesibacter sp.]